MSAVDDEDRRRRRRPTATVTETATTTMTTTRWHRRRRRRRWWLWRDDSTGGGVGVWIAIMTTVVALSVATTYDHSEFVNVVNVRVRSDPLSITCAIKCSGLMITEYMVLTAASCSGTMVKSTTKMAEKKRRMMRRREATTWSKEYEEIRQMKINSLMKKIGQKSIVLIPPDYITVQLRNIEIVESSAFRTVVGKYVHPDWNPETRVGDLALLRINERFYEFRLMPFPIIRGSWSLRRLNDHLSFRGYAKIYQKRPGTSLEQLYYFGSSGRIPDTLARRTLNVELSPDTCPLVENNSSLNPNWWSFLCSKPMYTRVNVDNTLCDEDIGGPLYSLERPPNFMLYGVFSHAYHVTYPFCATQLCYSGNDVAQYPCNLGNDSGIYYRFTAMMGPTASWLKRIIDYDQRMSTPQSTRFCASMPSTDPGLTTLDPWYDVDMYDGRRSMVMNRNVCPKDRHHRASAGPRCSVDTAVVVTVVVVTVVLRPVPGDPP